jgi:hypothetical protein
MANETIKTTTFDAVTAILLLVVLGFRWQLLAALAIEVVLC